MNPSHYPQSQNAPEKRSFQAGTLQLVDAKRTATADTIHIVPSLIDDAPRDFEAHGASLDRLRKAYGMRPTRANEMVLLGIIRDLKRLRREVLELRRRPDPRGEWREAA